ncbi:MAG: YARHG domain-containing protein [Bacteroidetes bacterium]|nr:YARHG domain-containing protein [Bacteroidota bacterium]
MKKLLFILLLTGLQPALANDGVFYATGNTLVPLKETTIRLKKEILNLERKGDWMQVDIYFEFFNPGPEKELTVGFVTPPAEGDVTDEEAKHPQVTDFMVMVNDALLPYKIAKLEQTGFKVDAKIASGYDFVYYFNIRFAKGITVIRHSYIYKGGGSVEAAKDFDYRLTTGATWANSGIDDFELNIDMGDDSYFSVPAGFNATPAPWQVAGIGRISKTSAPVPYMAESTDLLKMVYLRKGKLQLRATNFKPAKDLSITFWNLHNEVNLWCDKNTKNDFKDIMEFTWGDSIQTTLGQMTDAELRLYRNLNFARKGYDFKDETLKKAFSKYNWYIPDPNAKTDNTPDYYITPETMKLILEEEKRRRGGK